MNKKLIFNALSKQEVGIISKLSFYGKELASIEDIKKFLPPDYKYTKQLIYNLRRKKVLTPFKKGVYIFNDTWSLPSGRQINPYAVGNVFFPKKNYYIGYYNMFNSYRLTEQIPQTTFLINTSLSAEKIINGLVYKFIKVRQEYMYGIVEQQIPDGTKVLISDKERTMVDFVYKWGILSAGKKIEEVIKRKECDIEKFISYSIQFPRATIRKCIGVILDSAGISERLTKPLYETIRNTSLTSANYKSFAGTINKKWKVIINDTRK